VPTLAVTAIGADRPGIVAAVTAGLAAAGCNLEDTSMSILGGHFAMVLIVAAPDGTEPDRLAEDLADATADLELVIAVGEVAESDRTPSTGDGGGTWTVVVYGADHPGIVSGITATLSVAGANIVDLTTRVTGAGTPIYSIVMEVALPAGADVEHLRADLERTSAELGVDCSLHPSEADIL